MKKIILVLFFFSPQLFAQENDTEENRDTGCKAVSQFICDIQLRNSMFLFDKLNKGIELSANYPENEENEFTFNGALKYNILETPINNTDVFFVMEWRRNTVVEKEQNTWFLAFSTQSLASNSDPDGNEFERLGTFDKQGLDKLPVVLNYYSNFGLKRDIIDDRYSGFFDATISPSFTSEIEDNFIKTNRSSNYVPFKFNPSVGFQYEGNYLAVDSLGSGSVLRFSPGINASISPFNSLVKPLGFKELIFQTSYYYWYDLTEAVDDNIDARDWFKRSVTLVYDDNLSISIEFIQGSNPLEGYEKQNQVKISIKGKLN